MEEENPARSPEYLRGLHEAVSQGVAYGIGLLEGLGQHEPEFPIALMSQARLAARERIALEIVIRRYLAAKTLFAHFLLQEAGIVGLSPLHLHDVLGNVDAEFDHLLNAVTKEHRQETLALAASRDCRLLGRVQRLLSGELVDASCLDYELERHHLGLAAVSTTGARQLIRALATETDSRLLMVTSAADEIWAWLGSRRPLDLQSLRRLASSNRAESVSLGVGEPMQGMSGWRLTHRQARAAFSLTQASPLRLARYADVAIINSAAKDPVLTMSLQELYLSPLQRCRGGGEVLRSTLRAYFSADRNSSSAASALGVSRQTVANRLRQVENCVGQPLSMCATAVDTALRMEELGLFDP